MLRVCHGAVNINGIAPMQYLPVLGHEIYINSPV